MAKFKKGDKKPVNSGRKKGVKNKVTEDVRQFCEQIFAAVDPTKTATQLLRCKSDRAKGAMLNKLLEYYYGKPVETMKLDATTNFTEALARVLERKRKHG